MAMNKEKKNKGILTIELLVAAAIITVVLSGLIGAGAFSLKASGVLKKMQETELLATEAAEAVRNFRDGTSWNTNGLGTLTLGVSYHPEKSGGNPPKWVLVSGEETINGYGRKIVFQNALRGANGNIAEENGTADPETKKIMVSVSVGSLNIELISYLANWR